MPRRIFLGCILAAVLPAALLFSDPRTDAVRLMLGLERKSLIAETKKMSEISRRVEAAAGDLSTAARSASEAADSDGDPADSVDAIARASDALEVAVLEQRLCAERIAAIRRRIVDLEKENASARPKKDDLLSGDWKIRIDPGEQSGDMHLQLDGTIVAGDYSLEGGYSGSVRGTLVADRLRLERIDDRIGFVSVYYGRLSNDGTSLSGTWEATDVANGSPSNGRWTGQKKSADSSEK